MEASPKKIYIRTYYNLIGAKKKMEQKYYYGNAISEYGLENGRVDYATLSKCFDAVLNNDIMKLTYDIGSWDQVSGIIDNAEEIEELEEKRDELEKENESSPSQILENEINEINDKIEELESEQDDDPDVFQWYIVDDLGLNYYKKLIKLSIIMKHLICTCGALLIMALVGIMF